MKTMLVAWRDFRHTVLRKAFLIGIIGIPIGIVAVMALVVLAVTSRTEPPLVGTIVLIDPGGDVADAALVEFEPERIADEQQAQIDETLKQAGGSFGPGAGMAAATMQRGEVHVSVETRTDAAERDALLEQVRAGDLLALAIVAPQLVEPFVESDAEQQAGFELFVTENLDRDHTSLIERRLGQAVVRARAARAGLDSDATRSLLTRPRPTTRRLLAEGGEASESAELRELKTMIPMAFMMLLWIATFTSGQQLLMSTIEEKSNRVMEVLLSAVSPLQLMTGKIIGQGAVGLLIMVIYCGLGIVGLIAFTLSHLIEPILLVYLVLYFLMAFFMIAAIMAAVGSAVSDIREANTLVLPVMLVLMAPLMLWLPISEDPNGVIGVVFSFVPPAIPFVMILRVAADESVPFWQVLVTLVWGYVCMVAMIFGAARIFRVGVLMYGKPPTPWQLLKWLRYR